MSKKNIIIICIVVAILVIAVSAVVVYFVVKSNNSLPEKIVIEKNNTNYEVEKQIEITDTKQIRDMMKIYENASLEQNEETKSLLIGDEVKVDLQNGKFFIIQLTNKDYCYYENADTSTRLVISMPEGLLEKVNQILEAND